MLGAATSTCAEAAAAAAASCAGCCGPELVDYAGSAMLLFTSFLLLSFVSAAIAIGGVNPPDPSVHWPGHSWIHFMKRLHVIMSIGCFLMNLCACFFSIFALHRTLAGGFDTRGRSAAEVLVRELEFEFVAVSAYFFAGTMLLMGPVGIRCFCMVQQGLRSDTLAASVMCLIVGVVLLILSFFNQHLVHFPFTSFSQLVYRFIELSFRHCFSGGQPAIIMLLAWTLQCVSAVLAICSLIETLPWIYYKDFHTDESVPTAEETDDSLPSDAEQMQRQRMARQRHPVRQASRGSSSSGLVQQQRDDGAAGGAGGPSPYSSPRMGPLHGSRVPNGGLALGSGGGGGSSGLLVPLRHIHDSSVGEALHSITEPNTPGREDVAEDAGRDASGGGPGGGGASFSARAWPLPHAGGTGGAPAPEKAPPLWQQALNHPALVGARLPSGAQRQQGSGRAVGGGLGRRANSVASSIASLDSLVVD